MRGKNKVFLILSMFIFFNLFLPFVSADWWNSSWDYRKEINVTNTGSTTLNNFPIYLNITYNETMQTDYDDLRFVNGSCASSGGVSLDYEIENYTTAKADIWLRIPIFLAGVNSICMYYNNSGIASGQNKTGVWDSNYLVVQHMQNFNTTYMLDSTSSSRNGTKSAANGPAQVSSLIGNGQYFSDDNVASPALTSGTKNITNKYTLEAWIKPEYITNGTGDPGKFGQTIIGIATTGAPYDWLTQHGKDIWFNSFSSNSEGWIKSPNAILTTTEFYHVAASSTKSAEESIYVNGVKIKNGTAEAQNMGNLFTLGDLRPTRAIYFNGTMDEVRVSNTIRSGDWINQTYQLIANHNSFVIYGSAESETPAPSQCSPTLNQDWTISDTQTCNGVEATTGTGKIIIATGGKLYLINGANVTAKKLEIQTTGDRVFINSGSKFKMQ